ncbi:MAG: MBL fold metallo-hydrolase [Thermomicrobiales bacterium]|nr:MBL fold metallo-hydrolase [Thermomicrobiales bacterium]
MNANDALPDPAHITVTSLGSGSSGNALLVETASTTVLVDCGIGVRKLTHALAATGKRLQDVDAVLLSHEHVDHSREAGRVQRVGATIIGTRGTVQSASLGGGPCELLVRERSVTLGELDISGIPVAHDAAEPCGFLIRASTTTVCVFTDLGSVSGAVAEAVTEADLVVVEANHDEQMLRRGPYPLHLQRRILADTGHLSNAATAELLATALRNAGKSPAIWLAHLSEKNNRPRLAVSAVTQRLAQSGLRLDVEALPRRETGPTWRSDAARTVQRQLTLDLFSG